MIVNSLFSRWQKPWHQAGVPAVAGQAAPPTNQRSSLARKFSRCGKAN